MSRQLGFHTAIHLRLFKFHLAIVVIGFKLASTCSNLVGGSYGCRVRYLTFSFLYIFKQQWYFVHMSLDSLCQVWQIKKCLAFTFSHDMDVLTVSHLEKCTSPNPTSICWTARQACEYLMNASRGDHWSIQAHSITLCESLCSVAWKSTSKFKSNSCWQAVIGEVVYIEEHAVTLLDVLGCETTEQCRRQTAKEKAVKNQLMVIILVKEF